MLVSVWFLVAAGAILSDAPSVYTQRHAEVQAKATPQTRYAEVAAPAALIPRR